MTKYDEELSPIETDWDPMNTWGVQDCLVIDCAELDEDLKKQLLLQNKVFPSHQYFDFLKSVGFNQENYELLLELNQDPYGSVSQHIHINQFLLSGTLFYHELHELGLMGAKGHLTKEGIYIPKTIEGDNHFFGGYLPGASSERKKYSFPHINKEHSQYDVTISRGLSYSDELDLVFSSGMDYYLGNVFDTNNPNSAIDRRELIDELTQLNDRLSSPGEIITETDTATSNSFVLLHNRKHSEYKKSKN